MDVGLISALVSVSGAAVAVAALVVNVADGRAGRRNTEFLAHRDMWWQRWSWVADRATSEDETQREAASVMATALVTRGWTTDDDTWVFEALERSRALQKTQRDEEGSPDDLHDE